MIQKAEKYILVGDPTMVKRLKDQIIYEITSLTFENKIADRGNTEIKIIERQKDYEDLEKEPIKNIGLLLCTKAETDHASVEYCLPEILPSNIISKRIYMEKRYEPEIMEQSKQSLRNTTLVKKHFGGTNVVVISPLADPIYRKVDDLTMQSLLYFCTQMFRFASKK